MDMSESLYSTKRILLIGWAEMVSYITLDLLNYLFIHCIRHVCFVTQKKEVTICVQSIHGPCGGVALGNCIVNNNNIEIQVIKIKELIL